MNTVYPHCFCSSIVARGFLMCVYACSLHMMNFKMNCIQQCERSLVFLLCKEYNSNEKRNIVYFGPFSFK